MKNIFQKILLLVDMLVIFISCPSGVKYLTSPTNTPLLTNPLAKV